MAGLFVTLNKTKTMDTRATLPPKGSFYNIILELFRNKEQAGILYEDNGVTRGNGLVTGMYEKEGRQWMVLNDELHIPIDQLYAVNGTFTSDYSEC